MALLLGAIIRYKCRQFVSGDANNCLLPWYDIIDSKGSSGISEQVGDYNILYQFIIYIFTCLPIKPLYSYKIFSVIFDFALAIVSALIVDNKTSEKGIKRVRSDKFIIIFTIVWLCPLVFLNSSLWAQCDSIYTFFIFASFYAFIRDKYLLMFILYGVAFSFKFQAIFVLPFLAIIYVSEKKFSITKFLWIPIMLEISAIPGIIKGRNILDPFIIYFKQTGTYNAVSMNYNSFWNCLVKSWAGVNNDYAEFKIVATIFTVFLLGLIAVFYIKNCSDASFFQKVYLLHITVYTCVLFLPTMHERYGYINEITAIILMCLNKKFFASGVGIILLSCITYGHYLFGLEYNSLFTSMINIGIYCWYVYQMLTYKLYPLKEEAVA